jgi:Peptidase family M28
MIAHQSISGHRRAVPAVVAALILIALAWVGLRPASLPQPLAASAPSPFFSAARALPHVAYLAQKPRPIATLANAEARQYIIGQLRAAGLEPQLQTATVQTSVVDHNGNARLIVALVNNIVVRKPGTASGHGARPALMLATHYDTTPRSLGAADAGASVAAVLETLRALQHSAPLANDLICLIADGAEAGSLGARAFAQQHPWARQVGLVLNFDNGGSSGPLMLYDTHGANGAAVAGWARWAPQASGSSLMNDIYKFMLDAKDTSQLKKVGTAGLHFANIEGGTGYLGTLDTPARLDAGTLQHIGDTMLALVRHFGDAAPGETEPESRVYFTLPGVGPVHYAYAAAWQLTRLVCLLFFGVSCLALKRGDIELSDIANGAGGFVFIGALLAVCAYGLQLFSFAHPRYDPALGAGSGVQYYLLGVAALASALFVFLQRRLQAIIGSPGAALGALLVMLMLLLLASWQMPGATYVLAWPLIGALLAFGALQSRRADALPYELRVLVLLAGAAPAVVIVAPVVTDAFTALSLGRTILPFAVLALLLGLCTALLAALDRRYLVRTLALAGMLVLGAAGYASPHAAEAPQPNRMTYYKDATTWQAYWLLPGRSLDSWTKNFFPDASEPGELTEVFGHGSTKQWFAVAPRSDVAFPYIELLKDEENYVNRHVEFMLQSKNRAPAIELRIEGARAVHTGLGSRVLTDKLSQTWSMSLYGMGDQRLRFSLDMEPGKAFKVVIEERIPGLPPHGLPARPRGMLPVLTPMTETTIATDTLLFR